MTNKKLSKLIKISLLSAIAFIIMRFLEFPIPPFPPYLKLDLSEIPVIIGTFAFGPIEGVLIELIKNLLHGILGTDSGYIGELSNFLVGSVFVITAGIIYKFHKNRKSALVALITGTIITALAASLLNYYVFLPLYMKRAMGTSDFYSTILVGILPFNIVKGAITSIVTLFIYKRVSPILHK